MRRKIIYIIIILILLPAVLDAQRRRYGSRRWKRMRYELFYGIGATNFLGELGGANQVGTNMFRDLEISMARPLFSLGMRYKILQDLSIKSSFSLGWLRGDDKTTKEIFRMHRNLHFRSYIFEWGTQLEYHIVQERLGHRYRLRNIKGLGAFRTNTYFFTGLAIFTFNPKAKYKYKWYALQPLGTEGQELVPTRKKYKRVQISIPIGFGFKYGLNRKVSIGLEYGIRKTFTDYIDDVSTTYYNNEELKYGPYGEVRAALADPNTWSDTKYNYTGPNQQRGDARDKDAYMFMIINITYKLRTTRKGMPKFRF